ncbi:MAG: nicotinate-nucleotide adenylyltransferase [Flavobacteriaceae bacterium]|nr:nicotinate-nucleotide adenylyltransferase [Flavobacteriaceae bacterium]
MKKLVLGLLFFGLTTQIYSQTIELSEVDVSLNYQYLDAINADEAAVPVKVLIDQAVNYNPNKNDLFDDEFDSYRVSFHIPEGKIVAAYDKDGKIIKTIEKYKNVRLPLIVLESVAEKYPQWAVVEDVYEVNYHCNKGVVKKQYKIKLKNEDKIVTIKTDAEGNFI